LGREAVADLPTPSVVPTPPISQPSLALPDKPSVAVLPFTNMSGDPEQEFFSDGIAEDIITALSRYPSLFVIARNSCFTYKGRAVDVKQVGRELGVRYVLEGSMRKAGNRIRVTAQLVETETGKHVWAERYDRDHRLPGAFLRMEIPWKFSDPVGTICLNLTTRCRGNTGRLRASPPAWRGSGRCFGIAHVEDDHVSVRAKVGREIANEHGLQLAS
jgi:TolB-like protein